MELYCKKCGLRNWPIAWGEIVPVRDSDGVLKRFYGCYNCGQMYSKKCGEAIDVDSVGNCTVINCFEKHDLDPSVIAFREKLE